MDRRLRDLKRLAERYGYSVEQTGPRNVHHRLVRSGYPVIIAACSPRNQKHHLQRVEGELRRSLRKEEHPCPPNSPLSPTSNSLQKS